ncbi:MAG: SxtJ family membrane protein [Desulfovibrionaceae bacterium]|nr:SxtJ family membrane protein [Desulfovibrionaceae bacterium]
MDTMKKSPKGSFWIKATTAQARDTGMAMVLICLLFAWIGGYKAMLPAAILVLLVNMICPGVYKPLARVWFGLSHVLGTVMSKVILSLAFFLVLTPMGLLRKALGKDSLHVACWKKGTDSVFRNRDHTFTAADIEQPF